ncbi:MAG: nuclear transport factor 2 family protein [Rhodothermia bacterium]|nr:nuclear transport factor 2 family protein [Rhodothermia bacterium]
MSYAAAVAAACLVLSSCRYNTDSEDPRLTPAEIGQLRTEVTEVIDRFGRMWEDEDMTTFDQIVARDEDLLIIGTDAAERIVGYEAYRDSRSRQFAAFENVEFEVLNRNVKVSSSGKAAWFAEEFNLLLLSKGEPISLEGLRVTGGLEKRGADWVIVQLHYSVPVAGQAAEY